jgi:hypothetical protein
MEHEAMTKTFLRINQYRNDDLTTICDVEPAHGTAAQLLKRLRRIYRTPDAFAPFALVIELYDENEDLTDERIVIRADQGEWLLGTFFKLPRKEWRAFHTPEVRVAN